MDCLRRLGVAEGVVVRRGKVRAPGFVAEIPARIWIPNSVAVLHNACFQFARRVEEVMFEPAAALVEIGPCVLRRSWLRYLCLPKSLRSVRRAAFGWCSRLYNLRFEPNASLREFGESAFALIPIASVVLPALVEVIGEGHFMAVNNLNALYSGRIRDSSGLKPRHLHESP
jgi:hypothetical protein